MKENTSLAVTCLSYTYGLLNLPLPFRWGGWNPMLDVCWGSLLWQGVTCHFDPHQLCIGKRGPPNLSVAFCCCVRVVVLGNLLRGGMPEVPMLSFEHGLRSSSHWQRSGNGREVCQCWSTGGEANRMVSLGRFFLPLRFYFRISVIILTFPFLSFFFSFLLPERAQEELSGSWTHKSHENENHASWARHDFN